MTRNAQQGAKKIGSDFRPTPGKRTDQLLPRSPVFAKFAYGVGKIALKQYRAPVIKWVSDNGWRVNPLKPVFPKLKGG